MKASLVCFKMFSSVAAVGSSVFWTCKWHQADSCIGKKLLSMPLSIGKQVLGLQYAQV